MEEEAEVPLSFLKQKAIMCRRIDRTILTLLKQEAWLLLRMTTSLSPEVLEVHRIIELQRQEVSATLMTPGEAILFHQTLVDKIGRSEGNKLQAILAQPCQMVESSL